MWLVLGGGETVCVFRGGGSRLQSSVLGSTRERGKRIQLVDSLVEKAAGQSSGGDERRPMVFAAVFIKCCRFFHSEAVQLPNHTVMQLHRLFNKGLVKRDHVRCSSCHHPLCGGSRDIVGLSSPEQQRWWSRRDHMRCSHREIWCCSPTLL